MQVSDEELQEFTALYESEFGEKLSKAEASEVAGNLAEFYSLLAEPLPGEKCPVTTPKSGPDDPASLL